MNAFNLVATSAPRRSVFVEQLADEAILREAWHRVQRGGRSAGVDGVTLDAFRRGADARVAALGQSLVAGSYRPSPVKRIEIPKPSGGSRLLGVPTIADRIAQTAAAIVLHGRVAECFSGRSFAYRPFLGPRRAALYVRTQLPSATWVVTADIAKFFDNVEHRILANQLRGAGVDDAGIQLILSWLLAPVQDGGRRLQPVKGLPQGSPVAPVLANLYLTGFDTALEAEGFSHVRYADDFVVLAGDEATARRALQYVSTYLTTRLRLQIKPAKTQVSPVADGFRFVGFSFTRETWTVPVESLDRFKATIVELLHNEVHRPLAEIAKPCNDLVRGWHNYYFGNSAQMDRQLAELDDWRANECVTWLQRRGEDAGAAPVWFDRLVEARATTPPSGTYADDPTHDSDSPTPVPDLTDEWHAGVQARHARPVEPRAFSTVRQLRDAEIGRRQLPVVFENGRLRIPAFGAFVTKARGLVVVRRKKHVIFECAFDDLSCLTIEADGISLSTTVLAECARRDIPVALCRLSGRVYTRVLSVRSRLEPPIAQRQLRARVGRSGTPLVQAILAAKLTNQRALLLYHSKYARRDSALRARLIEAAATLKASISEMEQPCAKPMRHARTGLFLIEARAAARYWRAFAGLLPRELGFPGRQGRGAVDRVNRALNYGYALLQNRIWLAVHYAGLEPSLGLLHSGRRRTPGLVFDLMEPFRQPVVDRTLLGLIGRGARLDVNERGDLTLRTRALLQRAIDRRLAAGVHHGDTLAVEIDRQAKALRRSLMDGGPCRAYRMTW